MPCSHLDTNGMTTLFSIIRDNETGKITGYDIKCNVCNEALTKEQWDALVEHVRVKHDAGEPYV